MRRRCAESLQQQATAWAPLDLHARTAASAAACAHPSLMLLRALFGQLNSQPRHNASGSMHPCEVRHHGAALQRDATAAPTAPGLASAAHAAGSCGHGSAAQATEQRHISSLVFSTRWPSACGPSCSAQRAAAAAAAAAQALDDMHSCHSFGLCVPTTIRSPKDHLHSPAASEQGKVPTRATWALESWLILQLLHCSIST